MATPSKNEFIVPNEAETTEVKSGSDVTLTCHLSSEISAVDMEIRWFKGTDCVCLYMEGQMIAGVGYKGRVGLNKMKTGNISLELKDVRESDDGDYLCQVTSEDRTEEKTVRLSLKNHEDTEMLQTEETTPEQTVLKKKMEKSALMAVFSEWKDTSKCLEKAKQESKEKEAEIEELKAKLLQTFGKPEKENTQLENTQETSQLELDNPETKATPLEKQQLNIEELKVFTLYIGNKNALHAVHKSFIGTLRNQILNLREVGTMDESDVVLIFCPIVSRAGTDIDAALKIFKSNTGSKLAVLVVLHHTIDPEKIVPDSSNYVSRTDILTVDYLFYEDTGLLKCQKNSDADVKVVNWLIQQGSKAVCTLNPLQEQSQGKPHKSKKDKSESESVQTKRPKREDDKPKTKVARVFFISTGKTNMCDEKFIDILGNRIENLRVVHTVNESDIILVFCPIVSRAGTDIDAALKLKGCTDSEKSQKLTVLVVLHHTFDPEKIVPDSSRCVKRTDILTVDCLFYEDTGLLKCQKNSQSTDKVVNWLIQQGEKTGVNIRPCGNKGIGSFTKKFSWRQVKKQEVSGDINYFLSVTGDAKKHHVHFIEALQKKMNLREVPTVQESDVILLFCPDISGCHQRTDRPVVLISLHQTLDPDNSKRQAVCSVDYIFHEGEGLIECQINNDEISAVSRWLKDKKQRASRNKHQSSPVPPVSTSSHPVSYFTNLTGDAKKHLFHFIETTRNQICLNEVFSVEDSDVILLFCPDISDCNKRTDKPVVLISLHNTLHSDSVPSSNEFVNRRDILPLDCIFIEGEGLANCIINQTEYSVFSQFLSTKVTWFYISLLHISNFMHRMIQGQWLNVCHNNNKLCALYRSSRTSSGMKQDQYTCPPKIL